MKSKHLIVIVFVCILASAAVAQKTYSESDGYTPRKTEDSKKERKNKSANTMPEPTSAAVSGDVTVTIPFAVLDRSGSAIAGLTKEDITVFVDDVEVPIAAFEQDKQPLTVILVIDSSPSTQLNFEKVHERALNLVRSLPASMKVAVVDFNERLNVRSQPTTNRAETSSAISKNKDGRRYFDILRDRVSLSGIVAAGFRSKGDSPHDRWGRHDV